MGSTLTEEYKKMCQVTNGFSQPLSSCIGAHEVGHYLTKDE